MTGGSHPGRQGTCTWTSKPPWLSATAVVREFSYPLPSRGPLLSKQATPEASVDNPHIRPPLSGGGQMRSTEGSRTGPLEAEFGQSPLVGDKAPPLVVLAPAPCGRLGANNQGGLKATFLSPGGSRGGCGRPYSLPPEGGDRARNACHDPRDPPGGDEWEVGVMIGLGDCA